MDFGAILSHPDHQEIVSKLIVGEPPKEVSQWLKIKYNKEEQKHLHLPITLLQSFMDKNVDLTAQLRSDVKAVKTATGMQKEVAASLSNNKKYQERLLEYVNQEFDIKKEIINITRMARDRMEQIFDSIQENPTVIGNSEYKLVKYFEILSNLLEKCDKIVNNAPDQIIQHNIAISHLDQHSAIFQEAIRGVLAEMDQESAMKFIDRLTTKLRELEPPKVKEVTMESRRKEAEVLRTLELPEVAE
jgi:hypothetical protein